MNIENKWTWGNILATLAGIVSLLAIVTAIHTWGKDMGAMDERMKKLEVGYNQAALDSRTLIEVSKDVAYIKESILRIERAASLASAPLSMCPTEKPILVASHCRSYPSLD